MARGSLCGMRWFAIALGAWLVTSPPARAQSAPGSLAGTYLAAPAQYTSVVATWGEDCGPRPRSYVDSAKPRVTVASAGTQLVMQFPDRRLRSDQCWSPNKAVALTSTASSAARFQSECRTPASEPKKESGRYVIVVKGPYTLELSEESSYDWQLKTSRCQASVRMTQTLERVADERAKGEKPACTLQTPTRVRLRPGEAELQPGQRVCFALIESDVAGCSKARPAAEVTWELTEPAGAKGTLHDGCFRAAQSAAEAEGAFRVSAKAGGLEAQAHVRVAASDLSDITARRGSLSGAKTASNKPTLPHPDDLTAAGVERVTTAQGRLPFVWLALAAAVIVLAAGVWFGTRKNRRRVSGSRAERAQREQLRAEPRLEKVADGERTHTLDEAGARHAVAPDPKLNAGAEQLICPVCRRGFAPGALTCTTDGTALIAYSEFVRRHRADTSASQERKCARCGTLITADSAFCGDCGARVGP